jgi:hypothetical protein
MDYPKNPPVPQTFSERKAEFNRIIDEAEINAIRRFLKTDMHAYILRLNAELTTYETFKIDKLSRKATSDSLSSLKSSKVFPVTEIQSEIKISTQDEAKKSNNEKPSLLNYFSSLFRSKNRVVPLNGNNQPVKEKKKLTPEQAAEFTTARNILYELYLVTNSQTPQGIAEKIDSLAYDLEKTIASLKAGEQINRWDSDSENSFVSDTDAIEERKHLGVIQDKEILLFFKGMQEDFEEYTLSLSSYIHNTVKANKELVEKEVDHAYDQLLKGPLGFFLKKVEELKKMEIKCDLYKMPSDKVTSTIQKNQMLLSSLIEKLDETEKAKAQELVSMDFKKFNRLNVLMVVLPAEGFNELAGKIRVILEDVKEKKVDLAQRYRR